MEEANQDGMQSVCIQRVVSTVSAKTIETAAIDALQRAGYKPDSVSLQLLDYPQTPFPDGNLSFSLRDLQPGGHYEAREELLWRGKYVYDGGRILPFWVRVRLLLTEGAPITSRRSGGVAGMLKQDLEHKNAAPARQRKVAERLGEAVVVGRVSKPFAWTGRPEPWQNLMQVESVRRGQRVRVITLADGVRLESSGNAVSSGSDGEVVAVENPKSHKKFQAIVAGAGVVVVGTENKHAH